MNGQEETYTENSELILMRVMEAYMGDDNEEWSTELKAEGRNKSLLMNKLRNKFLTKMLMSEYNINKHVVYSAVQNFGKVHKEEKKARVHAKLKNLAEAEARSG